MVCLGFKPGTAGWKHRQIHFAMAAPLITKLVFCFKCNTLKHLRISLVVTSVTIWLDYFSIFGHLQKNEKIPKRIFCQNGLSL